MLTGQGSVIALMMLCCVNPRIRDPHVARTINVFEQTVDYVKQVEWTQVDIDRAIIATAKDGEKPIRPSQAASSALSQHLVGQTREMREERYAHSSAKQPRLR